MSSDFIRTVSGYSKKIIKAWILMGCINVLIKKREEKSSS
jgi:hypothetical protein